MIVEDYTPAFSRLAFAKKAPTDLFGSSITDTRYHLAKCLHTLTTSHPNQVRFISLHNTIRKSFFIFVLVSQRHEQWSITGTILSNSKILCISECHPDINQILNSDFFFSLTKKHP